MIFILRKIVFFKNHPNRKSLNNRCQDQVNETDKTSSLGLKNLPNTIDELSILVKQAFDLDGDIVIENEIEEGTRILISRTGAGGEDDYLVELESATYDEDGEYEEYESIENGGPSLESFKYLLERYISNGGTIESIKEGIQ